MAYNYYNGSYTENRGLQISGLVLPVTYRVTLAVDMASIYPDYTVTGQVNFDLYQSDLAGTQIYGNNYNNNHNLSEVGANTGLKLNGVAVASISEWTAAVAGDTLEWTDESVLTDPAISAGLFNSDHADTTVGVTNATHNIQVSALEIVDANGTHTLTFPSSGDTITDPLGTLTIKVRKAPADDSQWVSTASEPTTTALETFDEEVLGGYPSAFTSIWETPNVGTELVQSPSTLSPYVDSEMGAVSFKLTGATGYPRVTFKYNNTPSASTSEVTASIITEGATIDGAVPCTVLRGGGTSQATMTGYVVLLREEGALDIRRLDNGVSTTLLSTTMPAGVAAKGDLFFVRMKVRDEAGEAKIDLHLWNPTTSEPASPNISTVDTTPLPSGWSGIGSMSTADHTVYFGWAGFGVDGSAAPVPASGTTPDTTAPVVSVNNLTTTDTTPDVSGTCDDDTATLTLTVNGIDYFPTVTSGAWSQTLNTLALGTYPMSISATDGAGNTGTSSGTLIVEDAPTGTTGTITATLKRISDGQAAANLSGLRVSVRTASNAESTVYVATDGTTDANGVLTVSSANIQAATDYYVTVAGLDESLAIFKKQVN